MNATLPGAMIERELRGLRDSLAEDERTDVPVREQTHRQASTENRGVFELRLAQYLGLFNLACRINKDWRSQVFRGEIPPSNEMAAAMRGVFEQWLSLSDHFRQRLEYFERHGPTLGDQRLHLRLFSEEAAKLLREWHAPGLSMAVGLRTKQLSPEAAEKIKALLAERPR